VAKLERATLSILFAVKEILKENVCYTRAIDKRKGELEKEFEKECAGIAEAPLESTRFRA